MKLSTQVKRDFIYAIIFLICFYGLTNNKITHPIPKPEKDKWSIQLMQHPLFFGLAGHNYLVLKDSDDKIISEIHGLATDTNTGEWKYIGTNKNYILKVWEFDSSKYYMASKNFPGIILYEGNESDTNNIWNMAKNCGGKINEELLPYPRFGIKINGETENSNSVAYTLAICMNLDIKHLGLFTPGSKKNLLEK